MNYSTLKKTVYLSFVSLMAVSLASAQTDTTKKMKKMMMSDTASTAKLFGGAKQYKTFSIGINGGVTNDHLATGGTNKFYNNAQAFGYGLTIKDQLSHAFSLEADFQGGTVKGNNNGEPGGAHLGFLNFSTKVYQGTINGVLNVGSVSFLHRTNNINFFVKSGVGIAYYTPTYVLQATPGVTNTYTNSDGSTHYVKELVIPVGAGVKFKLSDAFDLDLGYTENFLDGFNFTGNKVPQSPSNHDKYSYGYAGLDYTFGSKSKPSLEWVNPIAMMYDELYDAALRAEVEALKGRVTNVESAVNDLKKDSDGDGVADQFDKCPNTPAGTVVDGSGCPIIFPKPIDTSLFELRHKTMVGPYSNIQFEFDSSVLKTSSYPVLDASSADLRTTGASCEIDGFASSEGTAAHNMRLSLDRANSVKTYLVNSGVDAKKLKAKGYGETNPIADNSTEEGRILNRRVQFKKK